MGLPVGAYLEVMGILDLNAGYAFRTAEGEDRAKGWYSGALLNLARVGSLGWKVVTGVP